MAQALNVTALIENLASIESAGVAFYESLAKHTKNEKVKKLASTMSRVEKRHQERFEKLAKDMAKKKEADPPDAAYSTLPSMPPGWRPRSETRTRPST